MARHAALGGLVGLGVYATLVEPRWLEVTRVEIPLPRLPPSLDGLRIAHLSDLHLSWLVSAGYLRRCIRAATQADPDLALVTGDFITGSRRWLGPLVPLLSELRARHGVWGSLGNHDDAVCPEAVTAAATRAGVRMLRNRNERVEIAGESLWLAGIDALRGKQYHLSPARQARVDARMRELLCRAVDGVDPDGFLLLLAHSPDILPMARAAGVDLILSGHTHGGQVRFPFLGATVVPSRFGARYAAGLFVEGCTRLYVSRGLGVVRLPVRFLCRPELAILTLRRG